MQVVSRPGNPSGPEEQAGQGERGAALILALIFTIISAGIVFTGSLLEKSNQERMSTAWRVRSQATQLARAGLTEGVSWFRRQAVQPVTQFQPIIDLNTVPPTIDTMDPDVGIVREFRIRGRVWGRYEVWKIWNDDPDPTRLAWRHKMQVEDVSSMRRAGTTGTSWWLRSLAYIFEREDERSPFNELPNRVLAMEGVEAEILRRKLQPPGDAAIVCKRADWIRVNTNGRVEGTSSTGLYYPKNTGKWVNGGGGVSGSPATAAASGAIDLSPENVFGVTFDDLRSSADLVIENLADFPQSVAENVTIVVDTGGPVVFDRDVPLRGRGLVYINGDCTIASGSNSVFNGLVYVAGDFNMNAPAEIEGGVVTTGRVTITGSGDRATVRYGEAVLNALRQDIGQYKYIGAIRRMNSER